ncbi:hypothetical protein C0W80_20640 [Photobacterium leiognathi subsp. mandapamensis]|uniref:helix-turn-helix domain-containing protein n=1 Tax=Photobacterium leiognathi TaxID=553611 RepID=UPI000D174E71|nr:helix-turn-helix domain-containing protein [Photobacterium leiognathi]PSU93298.1 hypothetical protein C0W80_20640 [Photobacterium leiognathi subsp. mandapamensis]
MKNFFCETDSFVEWHDILKVHGAVIEQIGNDHFFGSIQKKTSSLGLEFCLVKSTPQSVRFNIADYIYLLFNFSKLNVTYRDKTFSVDGNQVSIFDLSFPLVIEYQSARIVKSILIPKRYLYVDNINIALGVITDNFFEYNFKEILSKVNVNDYDLDQKLITVSNIIQFYINSKKNDIYLSCKISNRHKKIYDDAKKIMIDNISSVSLNFVADKLFVSRSTLQAAFSAHNSSFIKALTDIRIDRLKKELLNNENAKISMLCNDVGYQSISNAAKHFKIVTGLTFAEYKKKNKG